ncbi:MAG TPA: hypothetical protein EYP78_05110 [Candidatus Omnitrophica bacterium]|nr:hypothetical protein [Candidatus Omnitrophota bacterium]
MFLLLLKNIGAKVTVVEKDEERLRIAEKLGCEKTISPARFAAGGVGESTNVAQKVKRYSSDGKGMDVAIEATGVPEVWEESIGMVKGGGRVLLFGGCKPGTKACMDTKLIHYSEILLKGVFHHTPAHVRKAHELIATKKLNLDRLITHRMRLDSISEALEKLIAGEGIKIIIIP